MQKDSREIELNEGAIPSGLSASIEDHPRTKLCSSQKPTASCTLLL